MAKAGWMWPLTPLSMRTGGGILGGCAKPIRAKNSDVPRIIRHLFMGPSLLGGPLQFRPGSDAGYSLCYRRHGRGTACNFPASDLNQVRTTIVSERHSSVAGPAGLTSYRRYT